MPSSLDAARATIEILINDGWDSVAAPISWEGVDFTPPSGPWIEPRILWGDGIEQSMKGSAGARNLIVGVLSCNLYARPGSGKGSLTDLADAFRDLVNRKEVAGVRFGAPSAPRAVPPRGEGGPWLQVNVSVPFQVEELV